SQKLMKETEEASFPFSIPVHFLPLPPVASLNINRTNFELDSLMKFNMRSAASPYYITLVARLPSSEEECLGILDLTCPISRPEEGVNSFLRPHTEPLCATYQDRLLGWIKSVIPWPSSEIGFSDTKRFYMLNESELQFDWISLYVELAICDSHRWFTTKDLSNFELEIVQVAIESLDDKEPPSIKSKAAVIYIAYKDLAKARTGEPYHCQAVVRRMKRLQLWRLLRRDPECLGVHKLWSCLVLGACP
ncbi:hypothetical protein HID58_080777, partial [Brassica napus]